jgi:hypothetical protein
VALPVPDRTSSRLLAARFEQLQRSGRGRTRDCRSRDDFESGRRPALAAQQRSSKYGRVLAEDRPGCTQQAISTKGGRACFRPTARAAVTADEAADRAHPGWALPRHFRNPARFAGASLSAMSEATAHTLFWPEQQSDWPRVSAKLRESGSGATAADTSASPRRLARSVQAPEARFWRDARRTSSTVPRPAFVSARVRGASAVVVTPSVRQQQRSTGALASTAWLLRTNTSHLLQRNDVAAMRS